jgi:hypothetical protein
MKLFIFSLLLSLICRSLAAQTVPDTLPRRHELKSEQYMSRWTRFIPNYSKLQVAGGMGVVSVGWGWEYGRRDQWETDMLIGILPKFSGNRVSLSFTLKQNYIPWRIPVGRKLSLEPLETGIYLNMLSSHDFWLLEPEKYNPPYYSFTTNLRLHFYVGQRLVINLHKRAAHKTLTLFYELSMNDLYIVSAVENWDMWAHDIIVLSFGAKILLFKN